MGSPHTMADHSPSPMQELRVELAILKHVEGFDVITSRDISLDVPRRVGWRLERLEDEGIVERVQDEPVTKWEITF